MKEELEFTESELTAVLLKYSRMEIYYIHLNQIGQINFNKNN